MTRGLREESGMSRNGKLFLCFMTPGAACVLGVETRKQPLREEHAVFIDGLFEEGRIMLV